MKRGPVDLLRAADQTAGEPIGSRVLDIRSEEAFRAGHLPGAVSHPVPRPGRGLPGDSHFESVLPSIFLPPRELELVLVGDDHELTQRLAAHLASRGRANVVALDLAGIPASALTEFGSSRAHLWSPPGWLMTHAALLPPPAAGPVLDLACGSGRAAVWLAERGYRVTGIDWQPEALTLGRQLALSRGVEVDFREGDLRSPAAVPGGRWAAVLNFRYLQRDLLARFAHLVATDGIAMVRTFREAPGYQGHPRPIHRLEPGELLRAFPRGVWEVLAHESGHDPDRRPAAGIVARRRAT